MARRAVSWASVRKACRRILRVLTMDFLRRAMMMEAALISGDFAQMTGTVLIGAGSQGGARVLPALG